MGCQASYLNSHSPPLTPTSVLLDVPSKRFSTVTVLEKSEAVLELTMKILPSNNEIERVSSISMEISRYTLQNHPPCHYTLTDLFYSSPDELVHEEKLLFKLKENLSQEKMTLKMIPFQDYQDYAFKVGIYEIYLLQSHMKKNLIRVRDFFINDFGKNRKKFLILLFEEAEFTLADVILYRQTLKKPWKEEELLRLYQELADIGISLEQSCISHRDIRPENFWYSYKDGIWKLAGFNSARLYQMSGVLSHDLMLNSFRGKPEYQSPEIRSLLRENKERGQAVYNAHLNDVYGFGRLFLMLQQTDINVGMEYIEKAEIMEAWEDLLSIEVICKMMNGNLKRRLFFGNLKQLLEQNINKTQVLQSRKVELLIYNDLYEEMLKEPSLQLKILKMEKYAHAYFKILHTEEALNQFDELLSFFETNNDEENKANSLKEIGEFSLLLGNHSKGKELFKESIDIYVQLGNEARKSGNYKKAVDVYEKALAIAGLLYSSNDPTFIQILESLGNAYRLDGRFQQAKACQEKVLGILIKMKGENSIEVARVLNNLANTYAGLTDYDTSIELLKNSIRTIRVEHSKEGPNLLAMALCNLGEMYRHKKLLLDAKNCIEEALIIKEKIFGAGPSIDLAAALDNLGNVYYDMQEFTKAKKLYEKALLMKEGLMENFSLDIAISLNNLGNACRCLKEQQIAEGYYKKGIYIYSAHMKEKHIGYAAIIGNLGLLYKDMGKKKDAKKNLAEAVKILKEHLGEKDKDYEFFKKELDVLG